jgi:tetratricopeptide (TPR) repeat protein
MKSLVFDYQGSGQFGQAEALDRQLLAIRRRIAGEQDAETLWAAIELSVLYSSDQKYAQAEDVYRQALQSAPNNVYLLNGYAWLLLTAKDHRERRPGEALELARRASRLSPANVFLLNTLGLAELRNGHWDEAIEALNSSVKAYDGSQPQDFLFLAMAYHGRGDNADAEKNYAHGAEMARRMAASDPELRMLWDEAAAALGKPTPAQ